MPHKIEKSPSIAAAFANKPANSELISFLKTEWQKAVSQLESEQQPGEEKYINEKPPFDYEKKRAQYAHMNEEALRTMRTGLAATDNLDIRFGGLEIPVTPGMQTTTAHNPSAISPEPTIQPSGMHKVHFLGLTNAKHEDTKRPAPALEKTPEIILPGNALASALDAPGSRTSTEDFLLMKRNLNR